VLSTCLGLRGSACRWIGLQVIFFVILHGSLMHIFWAAESATMYRENAFRFDYQLDYSAGGGLVSMVGCIIIAFTSIPYIRRNFYWVCVPICPRLLGVYKESLISRVTASIYLSIWAPFPGRRGCLSSLPFPRWALPPSQHCATYTLRSPPPPCSSRPWPGLPSQCRRFATCPLHLAQGFSPGMRKYAIALYFQ
jgi:hypothetical protein